MLSGLSEESLASSTDIAIHTYNLYSTLVMLLTKSSDMLNKNTLGVKKVRGQEEAAL